MWKEIMRGIPQFGRDQTQTLLLGTNRHEIINAEDQGNNYASVDDDVQNGRVCYVDSAGIAKITYFDDTRGADRTEVIYMNAGTLYAIRNVKAAWKEYKGGSACTAKVYTADGELKIGVKVRR